MSGFPILTLMLLVPLAGAVGCLVAGDKTARQIALVATLIDLVLGLHLWTHFEIGGLRVGRAGAHDSE